jgi:hypothetical protein
MQNGRRIRLAIDVRNELESMHRYEDQLLTLSAFGIAYSPEDEQGPTIGESLLAADEEVVFELAQYLGVRTKPIEDDHATVESVENIDLSRVDAYTELVAAETSLRDAVRLALGDRWRSGFTDSDIAKLDAKRIEEDKRRDGITVSRDLLDYTETYHLQTLIEKNWQDFKPILDDKTRTVVYLGMILDVRNSIAHSRPVAPSERLLIAGAAGQLQNQLSRYRSTLNGAADHYASIDSARDSMGTDGHGDVSLYPYGFDSAQLPRLNVGDVITFELAATDPRNRNLIWDGYSVPDRTPVTVATPKFSFTGARIAFEWEVTPEDVGESRRVAFSVRNSGRYHRQDGRDDARQFVYNVNPPFDD